MADYERVREWIEKNVNPNRFKTLEAFIDKLESLPGVRDKNSVIEDYKKANEDKYAFKTMADLKQFKEDQKKALESVEKAESREEQLEALKKLQEEIAGKIATLEKAVPKVEPKPEPKPEPTVVQNVTNFVGKVGRFIGKLFGGGK